MGRDFGFLGDEGGVDVDQGVMTGGEFADDASQQELRVDVFESGVGVGEKVADIGKGRGA